MKTSAIFALLLGTAAVLAAPASFTYQGALAGDGGTPLTGSHVVEFRIYEALTGGTPLWGRAYGVTLNADGVFNVAIGDSTGQAISGVTATGLATILANKAGTTLYIGLTVQGSSGEIAPRQALLAVPYAIHAADAAKASGNFPVAGNLPVSGVVSGYGTVPIGTIVMWSGSTVPDGWALCNGQTANGVRTPDLRNKFIVGAGDEYSIGDKGGEKTHKLTIQEMPSHRHSYKFKGADMKASWDNDNYFYNQSEEYTGNNNEKNTEYTGGDQPHENRPPYYALSYIMRVK
jgi:microcystin-dependent protein